MSLSSPASWAAEMNFQSRYPGGIVVTMICLASLLPVCVLVLAVAFPVAMPVLSCANDEGVIHATMPVTVTPATYKNAVRFMASSLDAREHIPESQTRNPNPWRPGWPKRPAVELVQCSTCLG